TGNNSGEVAVGGLVGRNYGTVNNSYATGSVSGDRLVGGLVGLNSEGTVQNSYATGSVTRKSDSTSADFGGFVGRYFQGKIINCYSTGSVHYEDASDPTNKGFAGSVDTGGDYEMSGNFWDVETSGQTDTAGNATGKTTAKMIALSMFVDTDWDITDVPDTESRDTDYIWNIVDHETYPFLSWQEDVVFDLHSLTIEVEGEGSTDPEEGNHSYVPGTEVTVTAMPADGWYFVGWTGDHESTDEQINVTMDHDMEITAQFEEVMSPTVVITSPDDGATMDTSDVTIEWTVQEGTYPVSHYEIRLNDGAWINKVLDTSHTFEGLGNGHHNVTVRAVDTEGNDAEEHMMFTVETGEPEFIPVNVELVVQPKDGEAPLEVTINISADNAGELGGGISVYMDGEEVYKLIVPAGDTANKSFIHTFKSEGTYEITFHNITETVVVEDGESTGVGMLMWVLPIVAIVVIVLALFLIKKGKSSDVPSDTEEDTMEESLSSS
ncbi:MAG: GLUG motif-containing protein, partial [Thermoplasmata archaeon]